MKLGEIAQRLGCHLEGDPGTEITGVAGIESAEPGHLTFFANPRYRRAMATTRASAILVGKADIVGPRQGQPALAALRSANPYLDFARAIELFFRPPEYPPCVHPTAVVARSAEIGPGVHL